VVVVVVVAVIVVVVVVVVLAVVVLKLNTVTGLHTRIANINGCSKHPKGFNIIVKI
jgi:hypothetical protein